MDFPLAVIVRTAFLRPEYPECYETFPYAVLYWKSPRWEHPETSLAYNLKMARAQAVELTGRPAPRVARIA
jgi:hypothetical protein